MYEFPIEYRFEENTETHKILKNPATMVDTTTSYIQASVIFSEIVLRIDL